MQRFRLLLGQCGLLRFRLFLGQCGLLRFRLILGQCGLLRFRLFLGQCRLLRFFNLTDTRHIIQSRERDKKTFILPGHEILVELKQVLMICLLD